MKFYIGDPKEGGKQGSFYKQMKEIAEDLGEQETAFGFCPVHNVEQLIPYREKLYDDRKQEVIQEKALDDLEITEKDLVILRLTHLQNELGFVDSQLSGIWPTGKPGRGKPSHAIQIELEKYREYINDKIGSLESGESPKPEERPEPSYLLPMATLQKIHSAFDGKLWEPINLNTFYSVFNRNDKKEYSFIIKDKSKVDFYALLWSMFELSDKEVNQKDFIEPFLIRYNGSFNSFGNIKKTRIECMKSDSKILMRLINEALS